MKTKIVNILLLILLISGTPNHCFSDDADLERAAMRVVRTLIASYKRTDLENTKNLNFTWAVHMDSKFNVSMVMDATLKMEREYNGFAVTFKLTEPKGENIWSWLVLNFIGKYTSAYKQMIKSIELAGLERFQMEEGRLRTDKLEEYLIDKKLNENQSAIKIGFDRDGGKIKFWKNKFQKDSYEMMSYSGQEGPFTAFFNYMFIDPPETNILLINAFEQVPHSKAAEKDSSKQGVNFLFETETVHLGYNKTERYMNYLMVLSMDKGNLFDTVYSKNIFYQLPDGREGNVQVPYSVRIEGLIDGTKKRKKLQELKKRYPYRAVRDEDVFTEVDDILAARNVRMYLIDYEIVEMP